MRKNILWCVTYKNKGTKSEKDVLKYSDILHSVLSFNIDIWNTKKANDVIVYFNDEQIDAVSYVKGNDFIVSVKDVSSIGQLTLNCKGKDIEISADRIINEDIKSIISDLQIETRLKVMVDKILFNDEYSIKKKRIEIRKMSRKGLERKFIKLFLKLLEYIQIV